MKLLTEDGPIAARIKEIRPTHIATAYLGLDWESYVDVSALQSVVLSPTLGSNPKAIRSLAKKLSWDKVHFLDNLHAKFYMTDDAAVLGSSNLSNNGLQGGHGLIEAAAYMDLAEHPEAIAELRAMHARIVAMAKKNYTTQEAKKKQLKRLIDQVRRLSFAKGEDLHRTKKSRAKITQLNDYVYDKSIETVHIVVWTERLHFIENKMKKALHDQEPEVLTHAEANYVGLSLTDTLEKGDWVLQCEIKENKDGIVVATDAINWLQIDFISNNTATSETYQNIGHEGRKHNPHDVPFELTADVKKAFRNLILTSKELTDSKDWSLERADKAVPAFLQALKDSVGTPKSSRTKAKTD